MCIVWRFIVVYACISAIATHAVRLYSSVWFLCIHAKTLFQNIKSTKYQRRNEMQHQEKPTNKNEINTN